MIPENYENQLVPLAEPSFHVAIARLLQNVSAKTVNRRSVMRAYSHMIIHLPFPKGSRLVGSQMIRGEYEGMLDRVSHQKHKFSSTEKHFIRLVREKLKRVEAQGEADVDMDAAELAAKNKRGAPQSFALIPDSVMDPESSGPWPR